LHIDGPYRWISENADLIGALNSVRVQYCDFAASIGHRARPRPERDRHPGIA
jgi:hypothetical protein